MKHTRRVVAISLVCPILLLILLSSWDFLKGVGIRRAAGAATVENAWVGPVFQSPPPVDLSDNFNDNSLDTAKWEANDLFSGFTDLNLPLAETGQQLEIGPLLQNASGSHYRGIRTVNTYNFNDAYSYVELVQPAAANTQADAMFTVGTSVEAYYRIYVSAGVLRGIRKTDGVKTTLFTLTYDAVNHRFLRIRHNVATGSVTLDTAAANGEAPGSWVQQFSEAWNSSISLTGMIFEVKGGTWQAEENAPGKVIFDNFQFGSNNAPPSDKGMMSLEASSAGSTTSISFFRQVDATDVASFAIGGLRDVGSGGFIVAGINGTVSKAYLYWHGVSFASEGAPLGGALLVNGFVVQGTLIGKSSDNTWNYAQSNAFRADITSLVAPNPNKGYFFSNFNSYAFFNPNGVSLIVLYNDGNSANDSDVSIYDGNDSNSFNVFDSDGWNAPLSNFQYSSGQALLQLHVADGQSIWTDPDVAINGTPFLTGNVFQGFSVPSGDGFFRSDNLWDKQTFDVTTRLHPGTNTLNITSPPANPTLPRKDALSLVVALVIQRASNEVTSLAFEQIDSQLNANPNAGLGLRIYPDRQSAGDTVNRRRVRVKATTTLGPDRTVFFRSFDVDDPSTDAAPVDTTGSGGLDNRGQPQAGTLSALSAPTDANGVATVEFTTTMHPGDNFMVAASADSNYLNGVVVNGAGLRDSSGANLPTNRAKSTLMLTVWRRLHIEVDTMGTITGNRVTGNITYVEANNCFGCSPKRADRTQHFVGVDRTLDINRYGSSGSPPTQGTLTVNGVRYQVLWNNSATVFISTPDLNPPFNGSQFILDDDDDFNENDALFMSDEGETLHALADTFSLMQESDDPAKNIFAAAYIMPICDGGGNQAFNQNNIQFAANVPSNTDAWDDQLDLGWNSEPNELDDYWVVLLQVAYQGDVTEDTDPDYQAQAGGYTGMYSAVDDVTGLNNILGGDGSLVFIESQVDGDRDGFDLRKRSAPHEIGHQMGLKGDNPAITEFGIMNPTGGLTFGPRHLNVLRWRVRSPGFRG